MILISSPGNGTPFVRRRSSGESVTGVNVTIPAASVIPKSFRSTVVGGSIDWISSSVSGGATFSTVRTDAKRSGRYAGARSTPSVNAGKAGKRWTAPSASSCSRASSASKWGAETNVAPTVIAAVRGPMPPTWNMGHGDQRGVSWARSTASA